MFWRVALAGLRSSRRAPLRHVLAGLIAKNREVEIESRTIIGGRNKHADYLFRADGRERFVCEAKKTAMTSWWRWWTSCSA